MAKSKALSYCICPECQRSVPLEAGESYCSNDGSLLLRACPHCEAAISSPYSRFCTLCGKSLFSVKETSGTQKPKRTAKPRLSQGDKE